jgi:hypothetical protein
VAVGGDRGGGGAHRDGLNALVTNPAWDWPTVGQFLFAPSILRAVGLTLQLTVLGTSCASAVTSASCSRTSTCSVT